MRGMKQRHSQNAWVEIARKETTAPKCSDRNCEKRKLWHNVAGVKNAAQAYVDSQKNT